LVSVVGTGLGDLDASLVEVRGATLGASREGSALDERDGGVPSNKGLQASVGLGEDFYISLAVVDDVGQGSQIPAFGSLPLGRGDRGLVCVE